MGKYEKKLYDTVNKDGFIRLFHAKCKECGKPIWSVGEQIDIDTGTIKALFLCNCGAKYKKVVYDREHKGGYRYQQGLVDDMTVKGKKVRAIKTYHEIYLPTPEKVLVKKIRDRKENTDEKR